jgi:hypothetical protein
VPRSVDRGILREEVRPQAYGATPGAPSPPSRIRRALRNLASRAGPCSAVPYPGAPCPFGPEYSGHLEGDQRRAPGPWSPRSPHGAGRTSATRPGCLPLPQTTRPPAEPSPGSFMRRTGLCIGTHRVHRRSDNVPGQPQTTRDVWAAQRWCARVRRRSETGPVPKATFSHS